MLQVAKLSNTIVPHNLLTLLNMINLAYDKTDSSFKHKVARYYISFKSIN